MIVRIWNTKVDLNRLEEYKSFAQSKSQLMFQQQPGFLGVVFLDQGLNQTVVTFWSDEGSVAKLATSSSYQQTVEEILATGFLIGEQTTDQYEAFGGWISDTQKGLKINGLTADCFKTDPES